jgi:hypothetical protein
LGSTATYLQSTEPTLPSSLSKTPCLFRLSSPTEKKNMLKLTSLAVLAATGSAAPHVRTSKTVTATTDTALLEQQNWFGGALGTVGRVFTGHTLKQDEYMAAKSDFAHASEAVENLKKETFEADAACTVAKGQLKQITEANTKTKDTTESAEALREKKRLQVEQADAAVATASEGHEESKGKTAKATRNEAATKHAKEAKREEHGAATRDLDAASKKVDDSKAVVDVFQAKISAIKREQKDGEQQVEEQTPTAGVAQAPTAGVAKITETALIEQKVEPEKEEKEQAPVEEAAKKGDEQPPAPVGAAAKKGDEQPPAPVEAAATGGEQPPVEAAATGGEQPPVEAAATEEDPAATLAATQEAHAEAQKDVKTAIAQEKTAAVKKMETKEELENAKTVHTAASKTLAASKETENKAATKKEAAQTNADQIKNNNDGIDAREAAEQKMQQDEDDATEVAEQTCKVKQDVEQLLEEAEKKLERLKFLLTEKRTAYGDEKAAALKIVTDGIAAAEKKAAVAEEEEHKAAMAKAQPENAKEVDEFTKKEADARKIKIEQKILVVDGEKMVAELEKLELVEAAQEPIDPGYVAPKEVLAVEEPAVPDVAPDMDMAEASTQQVGGGASRQLLRGM